MPLFRSSTSAPHWDAPTFARPAPGILGAIGRTPLVKLPALSSRFQMDIFAKLECNNPSGSAKDRPALRMLQDALHEGSVQPGGVVIESSSGNMGVALAQACRGLCLTLICVVDQLATRENLRLMRALGAEIDMVRGPHPVTGQYLDARLERVQELLRTTPDAWWPNQYENTANRRAHAEGTATEIVEQLGTAPDYVFCPTSTCGTLAGLLETLGPRGTSLVAVDARGSALFGGGTCTRRIPGLGSSRRPALLSSPPQLVVHVTDLDCVAGCHLVLREEAILVGGSSGATVTALHHAARELRRSPTCVLIFVDRGERYLDTLFSERWVSEVLGSSNPIAEVFGA